MDEAIVLAEHAARVTIFHRGKSLRAQRTLLDKASAAGKIDIALETTVEEILGEQAVNAVRVSTHGTSPRSERQWRVRLCRPGAEHGVFARRACTGPSRPHRDRYSHADLGGWYFCSR